MSTKPVKTTTKKARKANKATNKEAEPSIFVPGCLKCKMTHMSLHCNKATNKEAKPSTFVPGCLKCHMMHMSLQCPVPLMSKNLEIVEKKKKEKTAKSKSKPKSKPKSLESPEKLGKNEIKIDENANSEPSAMFATSVRSTKWKDFGALNNNNNNNFGQQKNRNFESRRGRPRGIRPHSEEEAMQQYQQRPPMPPRNPMPQLMRGGFQSRGGGQSTQSLFQQNRRIDMRGGAGGPPQSSVQNRYERAPRNGNGGAPRRPYGGPNMPIVRHTRPADPAHMKKLNDMLRPFSYGTEDMYEEQPLPLPEIAPKVPKNKCWIFETKWLYDDDGVLIEKTETALEATLTGGPNQPLIIVDLIDDIVL